MESFPYGDILLLALVAVFILLRLRSVLGQKTGHENPQFFKRDEANKKDDAPAVVVQIVDKLVKNKPQNEDDAYLNGLEDKAIKETLEKIKQKDANFNVTQFLNGAKMAYEMVFDSFAKGDKKTLEMLLEKSLYENFVAAIDANLASTNKKEMTLVSIIPKAIISANLMGSVARLGVRFHSEQVHVVKDASGAIVEGSNSNVDMMDDEWVFERDVSNKNPNWKIIET